jgi:hypothetical protein
MSVEHPEMAPLHPQIRYLEEALTANPVVQALLGVLEEMGLAGWYLASGSISQTVWNIRHGFDPTEGIKDYDVAYFDPTSDPAADQAIEARIAGRLPQFEINLDIKNQAFVHLWYEQRFGRKLDPYVSTEHAISTWPTTASAVGVRADADGFTVLAPFGLSDLLGMVARPNKAIVTQDVYEEKTNRWAARWPRLTVVPW